MFIATIGVTASLEYEVGSSWTEITKCKVVNFPGFTRSAVDTTNLSITDFAMTFVPGMIDPGVITFEAEFSDALYTTLSGLADDRTLTGWRVTSPDDEPAVVTCDGFLTKCDVTFSPSDEVMISGEIKLSGKPSIS